MAETATKLPVKTEKKAEKSAALSRALHPFEALRRDMERLFDDFGAGAFMSPFRRSLFEMKPWKAEEPEWLLSPAVDIAEKPAAYEVTAELPGLDEKSIEVKLENGNLVIKGEKSEEKEEKEKDFHLSERRFGSFQRSFALPDSVEAGKVEASFKNGILTVTLPKKAEAQKPAKKIDVKAA